MVTIFEPRTDNKYMYVLVAIKKKNKSHALKGFSPVAGETVVLN